MLPHTSVLLNPAGVLHKAEIREGLTVADFGCGNLGHFVFPAARMVGERGKVYAVDILKSALSAVESRARTEGFLNVIPVWGDCEMKGGSTLPAQSVDITLVVNNLYQAKERAAFLREAARVTKVGGRVVIVDWKPVATPLGPPTGSRVSSNQVETIALSAGLQKLDSFDPGLSHWGLIFTK